MNFEEIYKLNFKYIYRFFYYKSVPKATVEDLCQEVFLRFYEKYKNISNPDEAKRILFGISNNVYKEWVRQQIKHSHTEFIDDFHSLLDFDEFIDEDFERKHEEQKRIVISSIESLNPKVKEVLISRFINNMSRKEIAQKLNMKEKDVHTYQKRGVKYLKKIISSGENVPLNA